MCKEKQKKLKQNHILFAKFVSLNLYILGTRIEDQDCFSKTEIQAWDAEEREDSSTDSNSGGGGIHKCWWEHMDGLVQERRNSSALAM